MIKEACSHLDLAPWLGSISLLAFFFVFAGTSILAWCLSKRQVEYLGSLPFADEAATKPAQGDQK